MVPVAADAQTLYHHPMTRSARTPFSWRSDPVVPAFDDMAPIVVFDGQCVLCSGFVRFVLRNDRHRRMRFLAAQTSLGAALYAHLGLRADIYETYILIENGRAREKSDAALRIFALLGLPWSALCAGRILPRFARDAVYDRVARNRVKWFGARAHCHLPEATERERFIA